MKPVQGSVVGGEEIVLIGKKFPKGLFIFIVCFLYSEVVVIIYGIYRFCKIDPGLWNILASLVQALSF